MHRVAVAGERRVERVLRALGELGDARRARDERDDQHAVVARWTVLSAWRRGSVRRNWSSASPSRARSAGAELGVVVAPTRRIASTPIAGAGDQHVAGGRARGPPPRAAAASSPSSASSNRTSSSRCGFSSSSRRYIAVPISAAQRSAASQSASVSDWSASISHR